MKIQTPTINKFNKPWNKSMMNKLDNLINKTFISNRFLNFDISKNFDNALVNENINLFEEWYGDTDYKSRPDCFESFDHTNKLFTDCKVIEYIQKNVDNDSLFVQYMKNYKNDVNKNKFLVKIFNDIADKTHCDLEKLDKMFIQGFHSIREYEPNDNDDYDLTDRYFYDEISALEFKSLQNIKQKNFVYKNCLDFFNALNDDYIKLFRPLMTDLRDETLLEKYYNTILEKLCFYNYVLTNQKAIISDKYPELIYQQKDSLKDMITLFTKSCPKEKKKCDCLKLHYESLLKNITKYPLEQKIIKRKCKE